MISIDRNSASGFISEDEYSAALKKAGMAFESVVQGTGLGSEWLGWRRILANPNDAELDEIAGYAAAIRSKADVFIVCGIGGSYTGAMALIKALNPVFKHNGPEIIYAGHHMSGKYLKELVAYLEEPRADGNQKSVFLNVISKSGTTLETALAFRTLRHWMHRYYDDADKRISATTGPKGGVLNKIIESEGYRKFVIPDDVGGRFSVLTPVGLLPIAVAGIDIQTLFYGAVAEYTRSENERDNILAYAATRYALLNKGYSIDVIGSFEPELLGFVAWIQQLIGESEGKEGNGLFPAMAGYSTDLHSVGQLIQEGQRNIIETLIVVDQPFSDAKVEAGDEADTDQLNYLSGKLFHEINQSALNGTVEAHRSGGVPVIKIIMQNLNAQQLGRLIYFYEMFTAVYVYLLDVNPFNQPGVEDYKKAMYRLLGKN